MAANFKGEGEVSTRTAPYDVASGAGALIGGNFFGVALGTIASGDRGEFSRCGQWHLKAASADTFAECANVYWDDNNKQCDSSSTGNTLIGIADEAKAGGETTVCVLLNGVSV